MIQALASGGFAGPSGGRGAGRGRPQWLPSSPSGCPVCACPWFVRFSQQRLGQLNMAGLGCCCCAPAAAAPQAPRPPSDQQLRRHNLRPQYAGQRRALVPPRSEPGAGAGLITASPRVVLLPRWDSAYSKRFSPGSTSCSGLWGASVELTPHTDAASENRQEGTGATDPAHYWKGTSPRWWV